MRKMNKNDGKDCKMEKHRKTAINKRKEKPEKIKEGSRVWFYFKVKLNRNSAYSRFLTE